MNLRQQNQITIVGACLSVAKSADYVAIWNDKEPADFESDIAQLTTAYGAVPTKSALAGAARARFSLYTETGCKHVRHQSAHDTSSSLDLEPQLN